MIKLSNQNFSFNSINLEFINPPVISLAIPQKQSEIYSSVNFWIRLNNNSSEFVKINTSNFLFPELIGSDGCSIPRQITKQKLVSKNHSLGLSESEQKKFLKKFKINTIPENTEWLIDPMSSGLFCLTAFLSWQANSLQLKFSTRPDDQFFLTNYKYFWSFNDLTPGDYRLKFVYNLNGENLDGLKTENLENESPPKNKLEELTTSFKTLLLIEPKKLNPCAVEFNGVCFETFVPERVITLPKKNLWSKFKSLCLSFFGTQSEHDPCGVLVNIGIRVTNNTLIPVRFDFFDFIIPDIVDAHTLHPLIIDGCCLRPEAPCDAHLPLVMPQESFIFLINAEIFWYWGNNFKMKIIDNNGCYWFLEPIKSGNYQIRFTYNKEQRLLHVSDDVNNQEKIIEDLWVGQVVTPFVEIQFKNY